MERKVLLLGLLQSLSIFASAYPDFNGTSINDWIDTEMASIEEDTRTLPTVESPPTNAVLNSEKSRENLSPFGALTTDWVRLNLLHDALPRDSVVKKKFKQLVRVLRFAYDEATRFSSESTMIRDTAGSSTSGLVSTKTEENVRNIDESKSTLDKSLSSSIRTILAETSTNIASVDLNLETISTSRPMSNPITLLPLGPNHPEDDVDTVTTKNLSQNSTSRDDEDKTTVRTDIQHTGSKDSKVRIFTIFNTDVGSSTEKILKKPFDRPATHEEYSSETLSKATTMPDQSQSLIPSARGSERMNEEADSTSSHRPSTEKISAEKTPMVGKDTSTVSNSVSSRNQSSHSNASSTRSENVVLSESVTMDSKQNSTLEEYSSPRTLSFERMGSTYSPLNRKQKILASTAEQNVSVELAPVQIPGESSEKSLTSVTTIPSCVTKKAESLSTAVQSQNPLEVKLTTEVVSSSVKELTTSSSSELHTDTNIGIIKNSIESSSIINLRENEEIKSENDTGFVTNLKTTGNNQDVSSNTSQSSFTSGSSTHSASTTHYVDERPTVVPVAKASDFPIEVQYLNANDTSEIVTEKNNVDKRPSAATVAEDLPIEVQHQNKNDTSTVVTEKNTKASDVPIEVQHVIKNDTLEVVTEKNTKASDLPIEVQHEIKNDTLEVVTEKNIVDKRPAAVTVDKASDVPIEIQHAIKNDTSEVVTEKNTKASDLPIKVQHVIKNDTSEVVTEKNTSDKRPTCVTVAKASNRSIEVQHPNKNDTSKVVTEKNAKASDVPIEVQYVIKNDTLEVVTEKNTSDKRPTCVTVAKASNRSIEVQHPNKNDTSKIVTEKNAKASDVPIEVQHAIKNDTSEVVTEKNTSDKRPTCVTVTKASDLPIEVQHQNKNDTSKVVTEKNNKASDLPIEVQHVNKNDTSEVVTEKNTIDKRPAVATVTKTSDLPIEVQHPNKNDTSKIVTEKNTIDEQPTAVTVAKPPDVEIEIQHVNKNNTSEVVTEKNTIDKRPAVATVTKTSDLPIEVQHPNKNDTSKVVTEKNTVDKRPAAATGTKISDLPIEVHQPNKNDTSKVVTEKNTIDDLIKPKTGSTTEKSSERSQKSTDKPTYIKNPLDAGSSRSNQIFRDYHHRSEDAGTNRSSHSEEIILYESGGNANSANVWRPHVVKSAPVKNNIWRSDKIPESSKPYGYQRPSPSSGAKANFDAEPPSSPAKQSSPSRTNSLRPRKRGSANADIEKQFRWFYTRGQKETSNNSRNDENRDRKITIQCKNTQ